MDGEPRHFLPPFNSIRRDVLTCAEYHLLAYAKHTARGLHLTAVPPKLSPPLWLAHIASRWLTIEKNLLTSSSVFSASIHYPPFPFVCFQQVLRRLPYCYKYKVIRLVWGVGNKWFSCHAWDNFLYSIAIPLSTAPTFSFFTPLTRLISSLHSSFVFTPRKCLLWALLPPSDLSRSASTQRLDLSKCVCTTAPPAQRLTPPQCSVGHVETGERAGWTIRTIRTKSGSTQGKLDYMLCRDAAVGDIGCTFSTAAALPQETRVVWPLVWTTAAGPAGLELPQL